MKVTYAPLPRIREALPKNKSPSTRHLATSISNLPAQSQTQIQTQTTTLSSCLVPILAVAGVIPRLAMPMTLPYLMNLSNISLSPKTTSLLEASLSQTKFTWKKTVKTHYLSCAPNFVSPSNTRNSLPQLVAPDADRRLRASAFRSDRSHSKTDPPFPSSSGMSEPSSGFTQLLSACRRSSRTRCESRSDP